MDTLLVESAIKQYRKALRVLVKSPDSLVTGGMISDVLIARDTVQYALLDEKSKIPPHVKNAPSEEAILQKLEKLDSQLREQTPRIVASVDVARQREIVNKNEFRDPRVNGWWRYLDQVQQDE